MMRPTMRLFQTLSSPFKGFSLVIFWTDSSSMLIVPYVSDRKSTGGCFIASEVSISGVSSDT